MKLSKISKDKKAAIEMSITTIIVIVLGVTLLILGLAWIRNLFGKIGGLTEEAFRVAEQEIQERMATDQKFYIPGTEFEVKIGKSITIPTGVQNLAGVDDTFKISVKPGEGADPKWLIISPPQRIPAGERKSIPVVLNIPKTAKVGSIYFYILEVYNSKNELYDSNTITVKVV